MFEIYKVQDGRSLSCDLTEHKCQTRQLKALKQRIVLDLNEAQSALEGFRQIIITHNLSQRGEVCEAEAELLKQEHWAKRRYRELRANVQKMQIEINFLNEKCHQIRGALLSSFEEWYLRWKNNELYTEKVMPPQSEAVKPAKPPRKYSRPGN
jgi:hypothetical protein